MKAEETKRRQLPEKYRLCLKTPSWARERAVFRLTKTAKQAILVVSSMEPDAVRQKTSRSKPDRVFRQSLGHIE